MDILIIAINWMMALGHIVSLFYTETGTFYFDANGYMVRGWQKIDYSWYYFDANGYMLKDWQEIGFMQTQMVLHMKTAG